MSQYPVEDGNGVLEAVNYLLSGPSGLGQNFAGFSAYQPAYLTGTFRQPYTVATTATNNPPSWYVAPVSVATVTPLNVINGKTQYLEWAFTTPQAAPPFRVGTSPSALGFTPDFFDGSVGTVITCTTTSMITGYRESYVVPAVTTPGTVSFDNSDTQTSTDANARVTVTGPTEQVFISSQLALKTGYTCTTTSTFHTVVQVNRYEGFVDRNNQGAIDYLFDLDATVSEQITVYNVEPGAGAVTLGQNIFTTVLDQPSFGYYWYICEILFNTKPTYRYDGLNNLVTGSLYNNSDGDAVVTVSGTSTNVTATFTATVVNVSSAGVGGQLSVEIDGTSNYVDTTVIVTNGGSGYAVGDTLKILGTDLGGTSPANDMAISLTQIDLPGDAVPLTQTVGLRSLTAQVIKQ